MVLRVLRRKFLRARLHNRDRLQPNYCDFSPPGLCCLLENTCHSDREGFEARCSIQLSYGALLWNQRLTSFPASRFCIRFVIGKLRKFHALSSFGPEAIVEQRADFVHHKDDRLRKEFEKCAVLSYTNNRTIVLSCQQ